MKKGQSGQILVLAIVVVGLVLVNTLVIIAGSQTFFQNSSHTLASEQALHLAEAGIDRALSALNVSGGSYNGDSEVALGSGSFSVVITSPDANTKLIESTGYVPSKDNPKAKRTIKISSAKGVGVSFNYGVQVGSGGLEMSQNSTVNGSVYSNGSISMENNSRISGDAFVAGGTDPSPDQTAECVSCTDYIFGKNVGGENRLDVSQSFTPSVSGILNKVSLKLKKFGSPPDVWVRLLPDNSGKPDKNHVLASGRLAAGTVTQEYSAGGAEVAFSSPPELDLGTNYWILVDTSESSSNYWSWEADSLQGYTRGSSSRSPNWDVGNPEWNSIPADLGFKTYMGGEATFIRGTYGATIGGDAHSNTLQNLTISGGAYYQAAENITAGSYFQGSPDPATKVMPISEANINTWKNVAADPNQGGATYEGDITSCRSTLGPGKYIGHVSFTNSCTITIKSPVWITGNLNLGNTNTLQLDPSFGGSSGVIVVDGVVSVANGNKLKGSGTAGSYLMAISTYNSASDGQNAINVSQSGNQGVLYASNGAIEIQNTNYLSEVTGQRVKLNNGVIINYETGLAGAFFSSGPSGAYSLVKGTYQIK